MQEGVSEILNLFPGTKMFSMFLASGVKLFSHLLCQPEEENYFFAFKSGKAIICVNWTFICFHCASHNCAWDSWNVFYSILYWVFNFFFLFYLCSNLLVHGSTICIALESHFYSIVGNLLTQLFKVITVPKLGKCFPHWWKQEKNITFLHWKSVGFNS